MADTSRDNLANFNGIDSIGKSINSSMKILRYPETLGDEEHPHYVMFFVNVPESRIEAQSIPENQRVYYNTTSENRISIESAEEAAGIGATAGAAVGLGVGLTYGAGLGLRTATSSLGKVAKAFTTALVTGPAMSAMASGAGYALSKAITTQRLVNMPVAIALQITEKPSTSYTAEWGDQEMGMLGNIATGAGLADVVKFAGRDVLAGIASAPKLAGAGVDFKALINKAERRVKNPQREQLFKSMGFREFSYTHHFLPRSIAEANDVFKIIKVFKQYMHPELDSNKIFLKYPAEWNIVHYYKTAENQYLHRIAACALTNVQVAFGGNEFTTFKGTQGMPSEIYMTLQFKELEILTSQRVGTDHESTNLGF